MNAFQLKILAIVLMVIDHVGYILYQFPQLAWLSVAMRIAGRLSFPIFAWLIATGCRNTRNIYKYMLRLFIFALISQIPFFLLFNLSVFYESLNIFFTLCAGVLAIHLYENLKNKAMGFGFIFMISVGAWILQFDYGFYGIWMIALLYIYYDNLKRVLPYLFIINAVLQAFTFADYYAFSKGVLTFGTGLVLVFVQPLSMFALILIAKYNGEQGSKRFKYLFYVFYPLHLLLLWAIRFLFA